MLIKHKNKGYVLLEMIIYVALFSIMIGGLIVSSFLLMRNSGDTGSRITVQEELNFVLKKIDWVLTNATDIDVTSSKVLTVTNPNFAGGTTNITYVDGSKKIQIGGNDITTVNVRVEELSFEAISGTPKGVKIKIDIDGQTASINKYLKI